MFRQVGKFFRKRAEQAKEALENHMERRTADVTEAIYDRLAPKFFEDVDAVLDDLRDGYELEIRVRLVEKHPG